MRRSEKRTMNKQHFFITLSMQTNISKNCLNNPDKNVFEHDEYIYLPIPHYNYTQIF